YNVRDYEEQAKMYARDIIYRQTSQASEDIKMTGKILEFFLSPTLMTSYPLVKFENALSNYWRARKW
ncbi:hypothetical protein Q8W15_16290, partial [Photobacterium damselae subsp. piscicida]|nr:hypothetical protein [Photobacterium damselae subsp. piscicida]MDP2568469.1 hypothetical protein [Photobacterium damselae subsp. piscicida]